MKKSVKRFIALMTVATMLVAPCTAAASSATSSSDGILEFDNSAEPQVGGVVLPTVTNDTFDFKIDPESRLNEYYPEAFPVSGEGIYFSSVATHGAIVPKDNTAGAITIMTKTPEAFNTFKSAVTVADSEVTAVDTSSAIYYVWAPKSGSTTGEGEFIMLTESNVKTYFKINAAGNALDGFKERVGAAATDQTVYKDEAVTPTGDYDPADYLTFGSNGAISGLQPGVRIASGSGVSVGGANIGDDLAYSALTLKDDEMQWSRTSTQLRVVNKSAKDVTVTAKVEVTANTSTGLTYFDNTGSLSATTAAGIHFDIHDVTNSQDTAVVITNGGISGTYSVDLGAATGGSIHYVTGETDPKTGGDVFKQFVASSCETTEVAFTIEGTIAMTAVGVMDSWKAYANALTAATQPKIKVVYSFANKAADGEVVATTGVSTTGSGTSTVGYFQLPGGIQTADSITVSTDGSSYTAYTFKTNAGGWTSWNAVSGGKYYQYAKIKCGSTTYICKLW